MNELEFAGYLKKKGKKPNVIERNIKVLKHFSDYLLNDRKKELKHVNKKDILEYIAELESRNVSAKGYLYVLMNYFKSVSNAELLKFTAELREERTSKTRHVFQIKNFLDVDQEHVQKLKTLNIKTVDDMLKAASLKSQRKELSKKLNIPEESILELVKLSDLTRLGYVKTKLTRLYYNAGLDSPAKIAAFEPEELHTFFMKFIKESGWEGMVPNPSDLVGNIKSARKLEKIVEE